MMRPVFLTRFEGAALEDYGITIEKSECASTVAGRERPVKTRYNRYYVGGIRRLPGSRRCPCGKPSSKSD